MLIDPILVAKNCKGCHSGGTPPNFTSYQTLAATYRTPPAATSKLITEAAAGATHNGVTYFSAEEMTKVSNWIENK